MSTPLPIPLVVTAYLEEVRKQDPTIQLLAKEDSKLMKVIGFIVKPFNPTFNTLYTTTIGSTIWMPTEVAKILSEEHFLEVVAHEVQHILDEKEQGIWFKVGYLFPQVLAALSLLAVFGIWSPSWLWWLLCLLLMAPLPAYWRYKAELNGYRTFIVFDKFHGRDSAETYKQTIDQLSGPSYYFAWSFKSWIEKDLKDESFLEMPRYKQITAFLHSWYGR